MAALLAEDHADAWRQVAAWHRAADLLLYHADTLTGLRERVVAVWPPERSPAAATYVDYLDGLIASVAETREAAMGNGAALAGILSTLEDARARVEAVNREWQWNRATEQRQEEILVPRGPNVTPQWREALNQRVYEQMTAVDQAIFEYTNQLTATQPYRWFPTLDGGARAWDISSESSDGDGPSVGPTRGAASNASSAEARPLGEDRELPPDPTKNELTLASNAMGGAASSGPDTSPGASAPSQSIQPSRRDLPGYQGPAPLGNPFHRNYVDDTSTARNPASRRDASGPERRRADPTAEGTVRPRSGTSSVVDHAAMPSGSPPGGAGPADARDAARVLPTGVLGSGMTVRNRASTQPRRLRRWPTGTGVEPVLAPRRVIERFDPGPGVLGIDR